MRRRIVKSIRLLFASILALVLVDPLVFETTAQQFSPNFYQNLSWRMIGPHRGGRTVGAVGVPGKPHMFYIGVNNGGVWSTNDYGRTWKPIFDDQPTGSIGTIALAPSNPDIIYVGSGEGLQRPDLSVGDGIYKSTDAGKTWTHLGLRDGQQIGSIIVDPRDPNRLFVAVLGHPYGPNEERGVFRSTDGGQTFQKVLFKDVNTGAIALSFDPVNSQVLYADLWSARLAPWENGAWRGPGSGLFKSVDGGSTWKPLTKGLPTFEQGLGRIGFCIAPSNPNLIYALVDAQPEFGGLYRSEDAGESWQRINGDGRIWGRGDDFAEIKVDPRNPDIVYSANVVAWKSTDGGKTFTAFKGAPGGDDYHTIWINPDNPQIILLASDQGATLTVNGGETWSSWYNQPTAQFYHVITDNQFPYWVYGGQQESGSVGIASRGNDGQITFREWHPVSVDEYGYVAPDPLDPNIIYGGRITRYDKRTGQAQNIAPEPIRSGKYRVLRTAPVVFSPVDPHLLLFATNVLWKTTTGGTSWEIISPDLSRERPEVPENIGVFRAPEMANQPRRGVIYTVAPSHKDVNFIWAGTDDGLIHVTRDGGKTWSNVTPPEITSWSKVSLIDASHFDTRTAYAAVNRIRLSDLRPHIYRTRDGGKTWKEIVKGLPNGPVNVVREDPVRKGLLFCGTEQAVYVSFNDGDDWQPLRLNMPATSIRDLVIHGDDVVVGTHGRSFWILDDITPLRQIDESMAAYDVYLFAPQTAYRVRWNMNPDTPLPPEEPAGQNPPDGAVINYFLKFTPSQTVVLEIFDSTNKLVRRFTSADKPVPVNDNELNIPTYWIRPDQILSAEPGMQRFVWDMHYPPVDGQGAEYPISAIYRNTQRNPLGPWAHPGMYTVKLSTGSQGTTEPLTIKMDPRVKSSASDLNKQYSLSMLAYDGMRHVREILTTIQNVRTQIKELNTRAGQGTVADSLASFEQQLSSLEGTGGGRRSRGQSPGMGSNFSRIFGELRTIMDLLQEADAAPTTQLIAASEETQRNLSGLNRRWKELLEEDLISLNGQLRRANLPEITN